MVHGIEYDPESPGEVRSAVNLAEEELQRGSFEKRTLSEQGAKTIIFVNYGSISSNSGTHILHFARELTLLGHRVVIVSPKKNPSAVEVSDGITQLSYEQFGRQSTLDTRNALLHAWTPRENVRDFVHRMTSRWGLPYLVHLEDNETIITAARLGVTSAELLRMPRSKLRRVVPQGFSNPHNMGVFLRRAHRITIITPSLQEFCPPGKKCLVLSPGVDAAMFRPADPQAKDCILREFGLDSAEQYVVYPGNTHVANASDVDSLYEAISSQRSTGRRIMLIRTGRDYRRSKSAPLRREDWLVELGVLDRHSLTKILQIADFFVQPGGVDEFNAYRLPSKIPECLAMGRPVIMPRTNIGLCVKENEEAVLLSRGGSEEIAAKLQFLMDNPSLAARIGVNGRKFAIANFNWSRSARALSDFYASVRREADLKRTSWPAKLYRRFAERVMRR
jgi:glycosyltransferase involved in cell wall biosynthesis